MLSKQQKINLVKELSDILKSSANFILVDFAGLTIAETTLLKRELKKQGMSFKVVKKSLLNFVFPAVDNPDKSFDLSDHKGSVAIVYGSQNPELMAKIIYNFGVKNKQKKPSILSGFLLGEKMMKDKVTVLAQLPSREVLLAQVLQLLISPVSGLARALDGISKKEKVGKQKIEARI